MNTERCKYYEPGISPSEKGVRKLTGGKVRINPVVLDQNRRYQYPLMFILKSLEMYRHRIKCSVLYVRPSTQIIS